MDGAGAGAGGGAGAGAGAVVGVGAIVLPMLHNKQADSVAKRKQKTE